MKLTGIHFFRMLYFIGADRGEDVKEQYEDSFIDDDKSHNRLSHQRRRPL